MYFVLLSLPFNKKFFSLQRITNIGKFTAVHAIIFVVEVQSRAGQIRHSQRFTTTASFLQRKLCYPGAMTRRWATQTRHTLRRSTATIMKHERFDLIGGQEISRRAKAILRFLDLSFRHSVASFKLCYWVFKLFVSVTKHQAVQL